MSDFASALREAEREVFARADGEAARRRVALRLAQPRVTPSSARARGPLLALAACLLSVAFGFWLARHLELPASPVAVRGEDPPPRPAGSSPSSRPAPPVTPRETGRLAVEVVGGACELEITDMLHTEAERLEVALPVGRHDVSCRRGQRAEHQQIAIEAGETARVTFRFEAPRLRDLVPDDEDDDAPPPEVEQDEVRGPSGTLVAIAIGGSCDFTVDGEPKGKRSSLRMKVAVGVHVVSCDAEGRHDRKSVVVHTDRPGIASFKLP